LSHAQQVELRTLCAKEGIIVEASRPLCRGEMFQHPTLTAIAAKHQRSVPQILLRWHLQLGIVAIPKSNNAERIRENYAIHDFTLDGADMDSIATLNEERLFGNDPTTFFPIEYN